VVEVNVNVNVSCSFTCMRESHTHTHSHSHPCTRTHCSSTLTCVRVVCLCSQQHKVSLSSPPLWSLRSVAAVGERGLLLASLQALKPINIQTHILFCSAILLLLLRMLLTVTLTSSLLIAVCLGIEIISQFFFVGFDFIFRGSPILIGNHFKVVYKLIPKLRLNGMCVCMYVCMCVSCDPFYDWHR